MSSGARRWIPAAGASRRRALRRLLGLMLGMLVLASVVWAVLSYAPLFRVSGVDYRTAPERVEALRAAAPLALGQPLVEVDTDAMRDRVQRTGLFSSVEVSRSWPSRVVVEATPRTPVVAVEDGGAEGVRLVDASATAYETVPQAPSGVLVARADTPLGTPALQSLVGVAQGLGPDLSATVTDMQVSSDGRVSMDVDHVRVRWGDGSDPRLKGAVVRELVKRSGVALIDVSAPLSPVTSDRREVEPGTSATSSAGPRTATSAPTGPTGAPTGASPTAPAATAPPGTGGATSSGAPTQGSGGTADPGWAPRTPSGPVMGSTRG